jgi:Tfp pilus assembly protein PilO
MLERKVRESGVEISKWLKRAEEPIERFVKVPVDIEITGTFMQIKRFFASLVQRDVSPEAAEERERIVSIESLVLAQPQVRDRAIILTAKFTAVTFRQDERAAGKPGGPRAPAAPAPLRPSEPQGPRAEAGAGASDSARRASAEPRAQGGS